ncbi:MAG: ERCC4 domain-containing protein [Candidatus Bathyarchaeia archaeon]
MSGTLIPYVRRSGESDQPVIIIDSREASVASKVVDGLRKLGAIIRIETLDKGDYVISDECAFERKTVQDFVNTLTRRDLFEQIFLLKEAYKKPFLLIEGYFPLIHKFSKISPSSVWGAIFALARNGIGVINTMNYRETVTLLYTSAKQEQFAERREPAVHPVKKLETISDAQIFFLASLPNIGRERAMSLLKVYKTPFNALANVDRWPKDVYGLGPKTAERVKEVLYSTYIEEEEGNSKNNRRIIDFINP